MGHVIAVFIVFLYCSTQLPCKHPKNHEINQENQDFSLISSSLGHFRGYKVGFLHVGFWGGSVKWHFDANETPCQDFQVFYFDSAHHVLLSKSQFPNLKIIPYPPKYSWSFQFSEIMDLTTVNEVILGGLHWWALHLRYTLVSYTGNKYG